MDTNLLNKKSLKKSGLNGNEAKTKYASTEGSLADTRAYIALYLVGTPILETGTSPHSCLLLDNHLYMYK